MRLQPSKYCLPSPFPVRLQTLPRGYAIKFGSVEDKYLFAGLRRPNWFGVEGSLVAFKQLPQIKPSGRCPYEWRRFAKSTHVNAQFGLHRLVGSFAGNIIGEELPAVSQVDKLPRRHRTSFDLHQTPSDNEELTLHCFLTANVDLDRAGHPDIQTGTLPPIFGARVAGTSG